MVRATALAALCLETFPVASAHAAPTFANVCTGLGVSLPVLAPVGAITDGALTAVLPSLLGDFNTLTGSINTNLQSQLSGRQLSVGVLDPTTHQVVSTPSGQCYVSSNGYAVDNALGLSLGGGQITGLGGTGNTSATAGDVTAIALGNGASTAVGAVNAVALGTNATATAGNSVALGANALAARGGQTGYAAFGLTGNQTSAGEVSIGAAGATRQLTNVAPGSAPTDAVNLGQLTGAAQNLGTSVAAGLGGGSTYNAITGQVAAPSFAVGLNTYANVGGAIAALNTSVANAPIQYSTPGAPTVANPGVPSNDTTLVGALAGTPVRLHNVAPGSLAATSTDAVNGSQLNASDASLAAALGAGATFSPTSGLVSLPTFTIQGNAYTNVGTAFGAIDTTLTALRTGGAGLFVSNNTAGRPLPTASGANASAGGFGASATGSASTVLGNGASDNGVANATVVGNGAGVTAGLTGSNSAIGQGAVANVGARAAYLAFGLAGPQTSAGEVSFGSVAAPHQLTNVAAGSVGTDAVNVAQLQGVAANLGTSVGASLGGGATYNATTGQVTAPSYTVGGNTYANVGGAIGALNTSVGNEPVQYSTAGAPTTANPGVVSNDVTLVGATAGAPVRLHDVAAGTLAAGSTDAVNGGQLYAGNTSIATILGGGATYNPTLGTVSTPTYTVQGNPYTNVGAAFGAVDSSITNIQNGRAGDYVSNNAAGLPTPVATGANASAGGFGAAARGAASTVLGDGATDNGVANATVVGNSAAVATGLTGTNTAIGQGAVANVGARTAYASFGLAGPQNSSGEVSFGTAATPHQLTNVAAGSAGTDVVNVAQLQGASGNLGTSVAAALGAGSTYNPTTGQVGAPSYTVGLNTYANVGGAITALNASVGSEPIQYSTAVAPTTPNPGVPSNDVTLVGATAGTPVALHNVAAGRLTAFSTDAVNGGQLNASDASVAAALGGGATFNPTLGTITTPTFTVQGNAYTNVGSAFNAVDTSLTALRAGNAGVFVSNNQAGAAAPTSTGANASAGGFGASAAGAASTVVGNGASDSGVADATVIGNGAHVAAGLTGSNSAIGQGAIALIGARAAYAAFGLAGPQASAGEVSFGTAAAPHQLTNVAAGSAATDVVNVAQLQGTAANLGASISTSLGGGATYNALTGQVAAPSYTVGVNTYTNVGGAITALNTSIGNGPVQYSTAAAPTTANPGVPSNDVTLVGANPGTAVRLHNVAAGSLAAGSTDAVDGAQLNAGDASIAATFGGGASFNTITGTLNAPSYVILGTSYGNVGAALGAVNTSLTSLEAGTAGAYVSNNAGNQAAPTATGVNASAGGFGASATGAASAVVGNGATDNGVANSTAVGTGATVAAGVTGSNTALGQGATATTGALTGYTAFGLAGPQNSAGEVSVGSANATHQVTNVAAGSAATDAVNVAQLQGATGNVATAVTTALGGGSTYNTTTGQITGPNYTVNGSTYTNVGGAITALNTSIADQPLQYSTAVAPTTPNPGVPSNDVTLVGANAGAPVAVHDVANGSVAAGSTDAVNGGQLNATGASVAATLGGGATYNTTTGAINAPTYTVGAAQFTTVGGAIGALNAENNGGGGSPYFFVNSTAGPALATGANALAAGPSATAIGAGSVAIGNGATTQGANSVAVGAGSTDGGQANVFSVGAVGAERRVVNVAPGTLSATSTDAVNGSQLYQTNTQVASLGHTAVQYDTNGAGGTVSSVTLASDQGGPVIIHNLAPGVAGSDAATVGQVQASSANSVQYATTNGVRSNTIALSGGQAGGVTISNLAPGVLGTDAVNVNQLQAVANGNTAQANAYTDQRINNLLAYTQQQIAQARRDAAGGTAVALASAGLRYDDRPGKVSIGGATSYYHDQVGIAFGIGSTSDDGRVRLNAAVSAAPTVGRADIGVVVGASFALN